MTISEVQVATGNGQRGEALRELRSASITRLGVSKFMPTIGKSSSFATTTTCQKRVATKGMKCGKMPRVMY